MSAPYLHTSGVATRAVRYIGDLPPHETRQAQDVSVLVGDEIAEVEPARDEAKPFCQSFRPSIIRASPHTLTSRNHRQGP